MPERLFGGNAGSSTAGGASTKNPFDYSEQAATTSNFDVERKKRELTNTPLTTQMGAQGAIPAKQDDVRAEFLGLPYDVKKSLIDTAVPVGNNKLQLGSVNSKELGKYESLQFTKEELQALASGAKYEGTQFSQPTGKETYGVQSQGTKNMMDMGTPDFTDYSKDQRSSDVDTFINADTMRMGKEERAKRMKGAGISTIDQLVGSERPDDTPNFFSELSKGAQRAGQVAQRSFYGTMEMSGIEGLSEWGAQNADRVYKDILKSPQLNPSKNINTDFDIGKVFDPAYIGMTMGQLFPHIAGSMASSIAGGLVAGPTGALAGAGTYSFTQEAGNAYNSLLDAGLSSTQAKKAAPIYGVVAASLDAIIPAKIAGKVLNASANNAIKEGLKETFIQGLKKGGVSFLKDAGIEAGTEGAQQFAQNLTERFFFENKDIWEDVPASTFAGLVGGVGFGGIGSVFDVMTPGSPVITEGTGLEETQGGTKKTSTTVTELKQQKTGLEATLNIAQKLAAKYPTNARLSEIVAETQDALDTVGAAYSNTLNQHFQNTKTEEINTPNLQVSVAQTPTGEWVAQGKAMVQGMTFEVPFTKSEVTTTSDAALAPVVAQIQSWVDEQIANPNVADVSALSSISDSLTQLLESPTRNEIAQDEKVLEAQDMSESEFLDKYATPETLPQLQNFYRKANQVEVQQYRKDIAEKPIRELAHDLGVKVEWVSHIATVEGKRALGSFQEQTIKLLQDKNGNPVADAATAYHEVGHAYFRTMMTKRQRADILSQVKEAHNITSDAQAEEILVEDLKKQADAKTARSDKYGKVLSTFLEYVKKFVNFVKSDKVATFYDDVLSGKRPSLREEFTRDESKIRADKEAKEKQAQEDKLVAGIKKEYGVDLEEFLPNNEAFRLEQDEVTRLLMKEAKKYVTAEAFIESQGQAVYHGTNREFEEFDLERSYEGRNIMLGAGKAIYLSPTRELADRYKYASSNASFDKQVLNEIYDKSPLAGQLAKDIYTLGYSDGWSRFLESNPSGVDLLSREGIDANDINDVVDFTRGSKSTIPASVGDELFSMFQENGYKQIPDSYIEKAKRIGVRSIPSSPRVVEAKILPSAKIKELGSVDEPIAAGEDAKKQGYDGISFTNSGGSLGTEIAIFNPGVIRTNVQLTKIWNQAHNNEVFRLEGSQDIPTQEQQQAELFSRALINASQKEITADNISKMKALSSATVQFQNMLKTKYDSRLPDSTREALQTLNEHILLFGADTIKNDEPVTEESDKLFSRVSERMKEQFPELDDPIFYNRIGIQSEVDKAVSTLQGDKKAAYMMAMGLDNSTVYEQTAMNIVMTEKALLDGDYELANQLIKYRSLRQTEFGQSIVLERASVTDNSPQRYMRELLAMRFDQIGELYKPTTQQMIQEKLKGRPKKSPSQRMNETIREKVKEAQRAISPKKKFDLEKAKAFISSLQCS